MFLITIDFEELFILYSKDRYVCFNDNYRQLLKLNILDIQNHFFYPFFKV